MKIEFNFSTIKTFLLFTLSKLYNNYNTNNNKLFNQLCHIIISLLDQSAHYFMECNISDTFRQKKDKVAIYKNMIKPNLKTKKKIKYINKNEKVCTRKQGVKFYF